MADTPNQDVQFLQNFEPDVFWQQHGRKILWAVGALALIGIVAVYQQRQAAEREEDAAARLAQAADPGALSAVAQEFSGKPIGAQALVRMGELHYQAGRLNEAGAAYQEVVNRYPGNPLADVARLSLVAIVESQGNFEAAKTQYFQLANQPTSYLAVAAKIGMARCAEALGQTKEAQQLYEDLAPAVRGTSWEATVFVRRAICTRTVGPLPPPSPLPGIPGLQLGK